MTENKRFTLHKGLDTLNIMDNTKFNEHIYINKSSKDMELLVGVLNALNDENEQLKSKNKELKDKYERKDRQLKRTKKDIEKYTDYFMNELNWDCDRIIKEVFK